MKDHIKKEFVNELRDTALKYRDAQQLREQMLKVFNKIMSVKNDNGSICPECKDDE